MTQQLKTILIRGTFIFPLLLTLLFAAPAGASPASQLEVTPFEAINFYVTPFRDSVNAYMALVTGFLNPDVELPAKVELAVPAGIEPLWIGEFSPDFASLDDDAATLYEVRNEGALDIYTMVLEHYPAMQIEFHLIQTLHERISETELAINLEYTPVSDLPVLRLMTALPKESIVEDTTVEFMGVNENNDYVMMRVINDVPAFYTVQATITYIPPEDFVMPLEVSMGGGIALVLALVVVCIAIVAGYVAVMNKRKKASLRE